MGIRVHPIVPPDPGPDCPTCSPDPWLSGATPCVIRAVFRGMANYDAWPEPPNGLPIYMSNSSWNPCIYSSELFHGVSRYEIVYDASGSVIILTRLSPNYWTLFDAWMPPCSIAGFANVCSYPDSSLIGGSAVLLDFPLSIIVLLTDTYNIQPDHEALYDVIDSAIPDHKCVRLTGRTSPGSVLVLVDTGAIPP